MVFVIADGHAYARTFAGFPSGLLNTQYLDSYCNLFVLIDGCIEYGFTDEQIKSFKLFVSGDDNSAFTNLEIEELTAFVTWFEKYTFERYGMILSKDLCVITNQQSKIETLSYQCNFGKPKCPLGKLVAQLSFPKRELANSMPVPCAKLDQFQCQRLDPVPSGP